MEMKLEKQEFQERFLDLSMHETIQKNAVVSSVKSEIVERVLVDWDA